MSPLPPPARARTWRRNSGLREAIVSEIGRAGAGQPRMGVLEAGKAYRGQLLWGRQLRQLALVDADFDRVLAKSKRADAGCCSEAERAGDDPCPPMPPAAGCRIGEAELRSIYAGTSNRDRPEQHPGSSRQQDHREVPVAPRQILLIPLESEGEEREQQRAAHGNETALTVRACESRQIGQRGRRPHVLEDRRDADQRVLQLSRKWDPVERVSNARGVARQFRNRETAHDEKCADRGNNFRVQPQEGAGDHQRGQRSGRSFQRQLSRDDDDLG